MKDIITYCKNCDGDTNHKVLFSKRIKTFDSFNELEYEIEFYMTIECLGCKTVSFLLRESIDEVDENGKTVFINSHFPDPEGYFFAEFNFLRPEDHNELPNQLFDLYEEVRRAFENDSNVLAGIGLRTLVEAICLHQKMKGKTLQEKIKNLHVSGLISSTELPILDKLRLIGNQSTHEIKVFSLDKLNYALDIVNHVLKSIYILPKINKKLKI